MRSKAKTVDEYLAALPDDRREALTKLRALLRKNLDKRLVEHISYGMIGWSVPHSVYPRGYHCDPQQPLPFASLASQKNHLALYLFCHYTDGEERERLAKAWKAAGRRLDMGKSCIRFKRLEDVPLDVLADSLRRMKIERFLGTYEASLHATRGGGAFSDKKAAAKKTAKKATRKAGKKAAKK